MELSIKEAAEVLGKSERTVRHMAQTGRLPARRIGSRWVISREDLSRGSRDDEDPELEVSADGGDADGDEAVADAETLPPRPSPPRRPPPSAEGPRRPTLTVSFEATAEPSSRHYPSSVRELDTFAVASALLGEVADARRGGRSDEALLEGPESALRGVLQSLADGCHQPDARRKAACFKEAQTQACAALSGLVHYNLVYPDPDFSGLAERIEVELLGSLGELRANNERRLSWRGRVITAAEVALERIIHRAKRLSSARLAERLDTVERSLHRALRTAL